MNIMSLASVHAVHARTAYSTPLYLSSFFLRVEKSILACTLVHDPIRWVCNPATVRRVV